MGGAAASVVHTPYLHATGGRIRAADTLGAELCALQGSAVIAIDTIDNRRVVMEGIPPDAVSLAYDPGERVCWGVGPTLTCRDLLARTDRSIRMAQPIDVLQVGCEGVIVLTGGDV